jgi:hypothetical protein
MLQIFAHTPAYVWIILAALIVLGVLSMREREMAVRRLAILPLAMLALSLNDISNKFGFGMLSLGAWTAGCVVTAMLMARYARSRVAPSATPGRVRVGGSAAPLAIMMAVFCTKYATAVMLAVRPEFAAAVGATVAVCTVSGAFNGILLGRMMRDLADCRMLGQPLAAARIAA